MGDRPAPERAEGRVRASETFKAVLDTYMAGQRNELKPRSYVLKERHFLKHCAHSTPWR
jgi:hypothetical protein